jgi:hypothetical protein
MGVDYHVHVGPYITVRNPPRNTTKDFDSCPKKSCSEYGKIITSKFCSVCGSEIKLISFPCEAPLYIDIYGEFDERLSEAFYESDSPLKDTMVLLSNKRDTGGKTVDPSQCDELVDMSNVNVQEEINKFKKILSKDIQKLEELFGKNSISVKWGILSWAC